MRTIDPVELEAQINEGNSFELIDVRARDDFDKIHVPGARSIPLAEFRPKRILRERTLPPNEPLYIMCREKALAELAAESLQADGCEKAIIVKGGMKAWVKRGLPVVRREPWRLSSSESHAVAVLAGVAIGLGLLVHESFFLLALLALAWWAIPSIARWGSACLEDLNRVAGQLRHRHS
jgi:rhodanese-related sulfurtransferase